MNEALARRVLQLISSEVKRLPQGVEPLACAKLIEEVLGTEELHVYEDARQFIWDIARHDGYDIPAYPMAGCGDVKEFLHDEGARDVPHWYERKLGMTRAEYDEIWQTGLVMVRNREMCRRVWKVPSRLLCNGRTNPKALLDLHLEWLEFALGNATLEQDCRLFKR